MEDNKESGAAACIMEARGRWLMAARGLADAAANASKATIGLREQIDAIDAWEVPDEQRDRVAKTLRMLLETTLAAMRMVDPDPAERSRGLADALALMRADRDAERAAAERDPDPDTQAEDAAGA